MAYFIELYDGETGFIYMRCIVDVFSVGNLAHGVLLSLLVDDFVTIVNGV